jgi:hypothetical protein
MACLCALGKFVKMKDVNGVIYAKLKVFLDEEGSIDYCVSLDEKVVNDFKAIFTVTGSAFSCDLLMPHLNHLFEFVIAEPRSSIKTSADGPSILNTGKLVELKSANRMAISA